MDYSPKLVKEKLNDVSSCFCLAKWTQVTIHLQLGQTHSCHHPTTHKIPLEEIEKDPSALHNTSFKKQIRKMMKEGQRPGECSYCWNVEDSHPDNISDRIMKSATDWSFPDYEKIRNMPWDEPINPSYVEVSFGNECNFRCGYCSPQVSSAIMTEYLKFGPSSMRPDLDPEILKKNGQYPISKDQHNPYVDAFWKWWPDLRKDLKVFRITGGEPLLNPNTFHFLEKIKKDPMPDLEIAINSNLGIPHVTFKKFVEEIKYITENKLVKRFQLYTSVDTFGKNGEFIRFGLNYDEFMANVRYFLDQVPMTEIIFMCTYNAFSVVNYDKFLKDLIELKVKYRYNDEHPRVILDTPYLKNPAYLSCYVLTEDFFPYVERDLNFIKNHETTLDGKKLFSFHEIAKFERILNWLHSLEESEHRQNCRRAFYTFVDEHCLRKQIKFEDYCPEYLEFYEKCKSLYMNG